MDFANHQSTAPESHNGKARRRASLPTDGDASSPSAPGRSAQPELLKDLNRALVLGIARRVRVFSRADLARRSGLSKVTAAAIVDEFIQVGLLRDLGSGTSRGGRPPLLLEYVPESYMAIGVEFAHGEIVAALTDLDARILHQASRPVASTTSALVLATIADLTGDVLKSFPRERILGLGFASPGLVDVDSGVVKVAIDTRWSEVPAAQFLHERTALAVTVANRSKAAALAERWRVAEAGAKHLIYVFIGSGIAAGIVADDTPFLGATSSAGELGHVTVYPSGPVCECGNSGCLHVLAGEEAIARRARELARNAQAGRLIDYVNGDVRLITADTVIDAALAGDPLAIQVVEEAGVAVGIALANVVNLFNPDVIIIGGPTSRAGPILLNAIVREARRRALPLPVQHVRFALSTLGKTAGPIGAAILVLRQASNLIFRSGGRPVLPGVLEFQPGERVDW